MPDDDVQAIKYSRGLKIAHVNINGLISKLDFIKMMLSEFDLPAFVTTIKKLMAMIIIV